MHTHTHTHKHTHIHTHILPSIAHMVPPERVRDSKTLRVDGRGEKKERWMGRKGQMGERKPRGTSSEEVKGK